MEWWSSSGDEVGVGDDGVGVVMMGIMVIVVKW